jgi:hypothetical protein
MVNCAEARTYPDRVWKTRSEPYIVCGSEVVLLEGKTGGFATKCLKVVSDEPLVSLKEPPPEIA